MRLAPISRVAAIAIRATLATLAILAASAGEANASVVRLAIIFKVVGDEGPFQAVTVPALEERTREVCSHFTELQLKDAAIDLSACGSNTACTSALIARAGADQGLVVVVNFAASPAIATLQLLGANRGTAIATDLVEIKSAGVEVAEAIGASVERILLRAKHARGGRLIVETKPEDAIVELDGVDAAIRAAFTANTRAIALPPAESIRVSARREGHRAQQQDVAIRAGETTRVHFELEAETSILESPWFWSGAIGAVAAAAAITAAVIARSNVEHPICLQVGRPDSCYE